MKHIYLFGPFIIACLLFIGCSPKETFYFSNSQDSFGHYKKEQQVVKLQANSNILAEPSELNQLPNTSPPLISTANVAATNVEHELLLKQTQFSNLDASGLNKKVKIDTYGQVVKSKKLQSKVLKKFLTEPAADRKVNGVALVGFLLSLSYIVFIITTYSPLLLLLGLIGTILSFFGLLNINKNPDKYSGKGFAWAGIIIGLLFTLFFVGFLLAFAGAF